jgi:hypothetical protein
MSLLYKSSAIGITAGIITTVGLIFVMSTPVSIPLAITTGILVGLSTVICSFGCNLPNSFVQEMSIIYS